MTRNVPHRGKSDGTAFRKWRVVADKNARSLPDFARFARFSTDVKISLGTGMRSETPQDRSSNRGIVAGEVEIAARAMHSTCVRMKAREFPQRVRKRLADSIDRKAERVDRARNEETRSSAISFSRVSALAETSTRVRKLFDRIFIDPHFRARFLFAIIAQASAARQRMSTKNNLLLYKAILKPI